MLLTRVSQPLEVMIEFTSKVVRLEDIAGLRFALEINMDLEVALFTLLFTDIVDEATILALEFLQLMEHRLAVGFIICEHITDRCLSVSNIFAHLRVHAVRLNEMFAVVDVDHFGKSPGLQVCVEQ